MNVRALAVVGHLGPDVRGGAMDAPHALAALAALGQPTRLSIFRLLVRKEPDGLSAGALAAAVGCPHNTLSTHVAILARAGLVNGTREGRSITYRADRRRYARPHCFPGHGLLRRPPRTMRPAGPGAGSGMRLRSRSAAKEEAQKQDDAMTWTVTNLVIEIMAGIIGAHAISAAAKEHSFGVVGHTIAGAVGGAFSGYFLQTLVATVVDSTGAGAARRRPGHAMAVARILAGLAAGAILTMAVGFAKHSIDQHRSAKG